MSCPPSRLGAAIYLEVYVGSVEALGKKVCPQIGRSTAPESCVEVSTVCHSSPTWTCGLKIVVRTAMHGQCNCQADSEILLAGIT